MPALGPVPINFLDPENADQFADVFDKFLLAWAATPEYIFVSADHLLDLVNLYHPSLNKKYKVMRLTRQMARGLSEPQLRTFILAAYLAFKRPPSYLKFRRFFRRWLRRRKSVV